MLFILLSSLTSLSCMSVCTNKLNSLHCSQCWGGQESTAHEASFLHAAMSSALSNFFFVPFEFHCFSAKKRTLWSLEKALSFPQLPPQHLGPEPQGSTLRLWSTAPKTLARLTLKVPFGALCPRPPSVSSPLHTLLYSPLLSFIYFNKWCLCACMLTCVSKTELRSYRSYS